MNVIPTTAAVGGGSASGAPTGASGGTGVSASKTGNVAHVNFRVRCEGLGYGEEVFLVQDGDDKMQKVRLFFSSFCFVVWRVGRGVLYGNKSRDLRESGPHAWWS